MIHNLARVSFIFLVVAWLFSCSSDKTNHENNQNHFDDEREKIIGFIDKPDVMIKTEFGKEHIVDYAWIRNDFPSEPLDPNIAKLIDVDNRQTEQFFEQYSGVLDEVFEELKTSSTGLRGYKNEKLYGPYSLRIVRNEQTNFYGTHKDTGEEYTIVDAETWSKGHDYYSILGSDLSPSGDYYAWVEDTTGNEIGQLYVRNIRTGEMFSIPEANRTEDVVFGKSDFEVLYVLKDENGNEFAVGYTDFKKKETKIIYEEQDSSLPVSIRKTSSKEYLVIDSGAFGGHKTNLIKLDGINSSPIEIAKFNPNFNQYVDHLSGQFFAVHNHNLSRYQIATSQANISELSEISDWDVLFTPEENFVIENYLFSEKDIAVLIRGMGTDNLVIINSDTKDSKKVEFDTQFQKLSLHKGYLFNDEKLVFRYQSFLAPLMIKSVNLETMKVSVEYAPDKPLSPSMYEAKRISAPSRDGLEIPISIIAKKETLAQSKEAPVVTYVYGAYGAGIGAEYVGFAKSLIDRGMIYAVIHVRGGNELGASWHEGGRLENRINTFNDFDDAIDHLINIKIGKPGNYSIAGESAAGNVMGVAVNRRPNMYKAITALVPFVDVLNTLLDDKLEYTISDWGEFGNPLANADAYERILQYCPVQNIVRQSYPTMYLTGHLNDPAVGYWEPMKYVYKVRNNSTNSSPKFLSINDGGHMNTSGFSNEMAFARQYVFLLWANGILNEK